MRKPTKAKERWTLVQHSGYGYGGDYQFAKAVETLSLSTAKEEATVKKAGGVIYNSYKEASDQEFAENYPPEVGGLIPRCRGTFAKVKLDGLRVYVPPKEEACPTPT